MVGPTENSAFNYVKLSFKVGLDPNFVSQLSDAILNRIWEIKSPTPTNSNPSEKNSKPQLSQIKPRTGIIGIERSLREQQKATDESISMAFQDLTRLMKMAKDMVSISQNISTKIRVCFNYPFSWEFIVNS